MQLFSMFVKEIEARGNLNLHCVCTCHAMFMSQFLQNVNVFWVTPYSQKTRWRWLASGHSCLTASPTASLRRFSICSAENFSAGHNQLQPKMRVLLLVALASQVHGRPQHVDYQPGNAWDNTRPAQPTEWSAWSSVGSGAPSPYNNYDSYNNYNPYSNYGPYIPGESKQPYLRSGVNSVPGSVGGPVVQDIGLNQQGSLPGVEVSRGDIGDPQITNNVEVSLCLS